MSTLIYHGAPGSYKTSSALQDYLPHVFEGRGLLTNIRGLTLRKIQKAYKRELPDNLFFYNFGSSLDEQNLELMRYFYLYVPRGVLIIFDEAQKIFPKSYNFENINKDITLPEDLRRALEGFTDVDYCLSMKDKLRGKDLDNLLSRPNDLAQAFDQHRHYNWDIIFTCPNIKHVSPRLRGVLEIAKYHRNKAATLGRLAKGGFTVRSHDPEGTTKDYYSKKSSKISKHIFQCYESTSTGQTLDTIACAGIFSDGKLRFFIFLTFTLVCLSIYLLKDSIFFKEVEANEDTVTDNQKNIYVTVDSPEIPVTAIHKSTDETNAYIPTPKTHNPNTESTNLIPFQDAMFYINGVAQLGKDKRISLRIELQDRIIELTRYAALQELGYSITKLDTCLYKLYYQNTFFKYVYCYIESEEKETIMSSAFKKIY